MAEPRSTGGSAHLGYLPTPTTRLERLFPGARVELHAKLDLLQLSGSTKERTATFQLRGLVDSGGLEPGGTVIESTSGNLGMALARQCAVDGYSFVAIVDERANVAACRVMEAYGAEIVTVATPEDGNRLRARIERVAELLDERSGAVTTNQYGNEDNPRAHHDSTLPELVDSLGGRAPDHLYVAMSTTGTLLGCQRAIDEHGWATRLVGVDSMGSVLFGGEPGERRLPGLGAGIVPRLSELASPDAVARVDEADMVRGARLLARREGILAGASTGAIVAAIGRDLDRFHNDEVVAMLVHDGGTAYLPTLYNDDWVRGEIDAAERALEVPSRPNPFARHG